MAHLEGAYQQVGQRLGNIDLRFDAVDRRFDAVDRKIDLVRDELNKKIDVLDGKIDQRFMWTVGIVITTWLTTIASIYLHH
jgi:tetrahydromethanopterin S-methyltransferase subunit G